MGANDERLVVRSHVARDLLQNAALFKTDHLAVWEYVSNSLQYVDPSISPCVKVTLDIKKKYISIQDNGRGMDWSGLQNFFIMHGENIDRKQGKPGRGLFGTGKSAAFGIGQTLQITTIRNKQRSMVKLERSAVETMESVDEIPVTVLEKEKPTNEPNGTKIEILNIHIRKLDQRGIIRYIERHLARWPKDTLVFVNNHECEWQEPAVAYEHTFTPDATFKEILGNIELIIKVSKSPLDEDTRGISIYANGVWHATTLAGCENKDMSQYLFGSIDVPKLDEDNSPTPPYDLSRSMRLNTENELVKSIYTFIGSKLDAVRRELVDADKKRRESEEAKILEREAEEIAKLINDDFDEYRQKVSKVKAVGGDGDDTHSVSRGGDNDNELTAGSEIPGEILDDIGGVGRGSGSSGDGIVPPTMGPQVDPKDNGDNVAKPSGDTGRRPKQRGGFMVKFKEMGEQTARAEYIRTERTIYINLDHPQLVAAKGAGSIDDLPFRRLSYEIAFSEYAIALASELAGHDYYLDPSDPIVEIRDTINRLARRGAKLYSDRV